jgi:UDP-hydrolysing UDP-N-acetyl-D-glucosamine 2-epimerase
MARRRIAVVLTDRANYGRLWPVMKAVKEHPALELLTVCAGTMLLERFNQPERIVEADGFRVDGRVYMELEGSVPTTMAKSVGYGIVEFVSEFQRLKPDMVLLIGDRYEALAAAIAAAYQNICIAHIQGGEVSGSIDESARHAISKFAHYHFPATERAAQYLVRMGEDPRCVFCFGCPCGDYIRGLDTGLPADVFTRIGVGAPVSPEKPYLLVIFHPVTTEFGDEGRQVRELIAALDQLRHPTVWLWPNIDAGADHISKALRLHREHRHADVWLRLVKNFDPATFQKVLKKAVCAVGNSSSFVRDTTFTGTPVVLVGDRQEGRETAENAVTVPAEAEAVFAAVRRQLAHGRYQPSALYGRGGAAGRIATTLAELQPYSQKRLHYIHG